MSTVCHFNKNVKREFALNVRKENDLVLVTSATFKGNRELVFPIVNLTKPQQKLSKEEVKNTKSFVSGLIKKLGII